MQAYSAQGPTSARRLCTRRGGMYLARKAANLMCRLLNRAPRVPAMMPMPRKMGTSQM